jgi:hypothetical protein
MYDAPMRTPRAVALACLVLAVTVGWFAIGRLLYVLPIGLDESAFPFGVPLQALAKRFAPGLTHAVSGVILLAAGLLLLGAAACAAMRRAVRAQAAAHDPGRRSFLLGIGSHPRRARSALHRDQVLHTSRGRSRTPTSRAR